MCGCRNKTTQTAKKTTVVKTTTVQKNYYSSKERAHVEYMNWLRSINWAGDN